MSKQKFFFFPIALLSPSDKGDHPVTLQRIISWCLFYVGKKAIERMEESATDGILSTVETADDYDDDEDLHRALFMGARTLNVIIRSFCREVREIKIAEQIITRHRVHGEPAMLSVATELLWECNSKTGISYRDFTTMCAVNSIVGAKQYPSLVRRDLIRARQAGFKTAKMSDTMRAQCGKKEFREPLTESELRTTLDALERKGLITRCAASKRKTYFMLGKVDRGTMRTRVAVLIDNPRKNLTAERTKDLDFMKRANGNSTE